VRPPFTPQAIVFDLDGLLVDTEPRWEAAERRLIAELDGDWDPEVRHQLLGVGPETSARILAEHLGVADHAMVARRLLLAALAEFRRGVTALEGAEELLTALRGRVPTAVATNSRRVLADTALMNAGLDGLVDALVCVEDVDEPKPAPDPYRRACAELDADPAGAVAFEDSGPGVTAAVAAGLWTVACPSVPGASPEGAHAVIASLREVDPEALLAGATDAPS